ncbi:diacylglycerol/lipid kinase family protein [Legionella cardiaca]|uniref:Diacylglycerol kinase family protein n=1 Tax=Legionella cardiaca TaxID=1071983 RepID=A0ABY8AXY3_9GAMM|nr:diacylglycerol kinase family protein [Legionella cardiaca]WED43972.1 diacylglycerol kinase family protein [Legionella cardiaca]
MTKIAIVVNKKAKNAALIDNYLDAFNKEQIDYNCFQIEPQDLDATLKQCVQDCSLLLVGGGDGTIRNAAQYCANRPITLGVLPLGTMNHFAKELALPFTVNDLIAAIKKPKVIKIDLAEVNGLVFINNSSLGFYPRLAKKRDHYAKYFPKWLSYIPSFLETLRYHDTFHVVIQSQNLNRTIRTSFFMVSNNLYSYQFPITIGRETFNQKALGIYFLKYGKMTILKVFEHLLKRASNFEIMKSETTIKVNVKNRREVNISLDGDAIMIETPLIYRCLPDSLQLLTLK